MTKKNPNVIPVTIHSDAMPKRNYYRSWSFALPLVVFGFLTAAFSYAMPVLEWWKLVVLLPLLFVGWYTIFSTPNHYRKVWILLGLGRFVAHLEADGHYTRKRRPMVSELVRPNPDKGE